jgi:bacillithiol biosynthesis cysteine-adding enzyme BshC
MDCRALPPHCLPHQPKLFVQYAENFSRVASFYEHPPTMAALKRVASKLDFPKGRRREVAAILRRQNNDYGAGAATIENLQRLEKGAVAIVSGQQVGLFSGPAYAVYKALSAIQVAQELTQQGIAAVPVFWMATEDHDLDEVRHVTWFDGEKLVRFELPAEPQTGLPVGNIPLGAPVEAAAREAAEILANQGSELLAQMLRESYRATESYGSAFAKLFARLFATQGLILLDPLDAELHRVAAPVYLQAVRERDTLNEKLLARGKELENAGFAAQVKVTARSTLLFYMAAKADGATALEGVATRQVVTASGGNFEAGGKSWTREEFASLVEKAPQNFSPNVLLRAVVQDYLLPTAAYIGGPAEISYLAQSEVVYRQLLGRMPVILPRAAFTLVNAKARKLLRRYHLKIEDLWLGSQEVRRRMEAGSAPKPLAADFDRDRKKIEKMLAQLKKQIVKVDPTLQAAVETAERKIVYQLEKLRRKSGKAQDLKVGLLDGHQRFLESLLYPHKSLQSRELCLLPFLARWGAGGLMELQRLSSSKNLGRHCLVDLL